MKNYYLVRIDKLLIYLNSTYIAVDGKKTLAMVARYLVKKRLSSNAVNLLNSIGPTLARKILYIARLIVSIALKDSLRCFVSESDIFCTCDDYLTDREEARVLVVIGQTFSQEGIHGFVKGAFSPHSVIIFSRKFALA